MQGNKKRELWIVLMKEVIWIMALHFPINMRLFSDCYSGSDRVTFWKQGLSRYSQEVVLLLQHVALYLPKQRPILRVIKLGFGLWLLIFASICDWWGSGGGREGCPRIFSWMSWPNATLNNYLLLPTSTSSAVSSHFASNLQRFWPCGLKTIRIKVSRLFCGNAHCRRCLWSLRILVWISGSELSNPGKNGSWVLMSLIIWNICTV